MKTKGAQERKRTFLLITIPVIALFFCFNTLPLIRGFIYSFTNFKGYGSYDWVGLRNYQDLLGDARVGKSYLFTFKYALAGTIITNVISLILALGLNSKIRAKSALRGIYFIPNVLGGLVIGYIFSFIFTYVLPAIGQNLGIEALSGSMLSSTSKAWIAIVIVGCWQAIAMNTIIYISGLQTVPEDVYEAGSLDGVTGWKKFKYLTFPLIIPFFSTNMVLSMKNFLMVFDQIMALTKGGPSQSTESISYLIYNNGMSGGQFGFQSANAFVFFVMIVAISVFQMTVTNRKEEQLCIRFRLEIRTNITGRLRYCWGAFFAGKLEPFQLPGSDGSNRFLEFSRKQSFSYSCNRGSSGVDSNSSVLYCMSEADFKWCCKRSREVV